MKIICKALFLALFFIAGKTVAQDFVYTPKNPAFGGNPYNSNFTQSLNQQILSQISRQIVSKQFGEGGLTAGNYVLGDYQIQIADQNSGLNITIMDTKSGSQTSVMVPYF